MKRKTKVGDIIRLSFADSSILPRIGQVVDKRKTFFIVEINKWRWLVKHTAYGGKRYYITHLTDEEAMLYKLEDA